MAVAIGIQDSSVSLRCCYRSTAASHGAGMSCCLRLDLGERLDHQGGATVTVQGGYGYVRLPLAPEFARCEGRVEGSGDAATGALDDGRVSQQLREEAGLYHRAAAQRRRERGSLDGAWIRCRRCRATSVPALVHVAEGRSLPDVDVSSLVDFMQCCEEINFDWRCVFPAEVASTVQREQPRKAHLPIGSATHRVMQDGEVNTEPFEVEATPEQQKLPICFLGAHSLHMRAPPPPSEAVQIFPTEAFVEAPCYRHTTSADGAGIWAPLRCTGCAATLGAVRSKATSTMGTVTAAAHAPVWFDSTAPPECGSTLQLLKYAVTISNSAFGQSALRDACDAFQGYSLAALVADRILHVAEEEEGEHTRQFTIASSHEEATTPDVAILLLSPYVTLATNQPHDGNAVAADGSNDAAGTNAVVDALKVLYTTSPAAIAAVGASAHRLVLEEAADRIAITHSLESSTSMLAPTARAVGALRVGFLPVTPTWD